MIVIGGAGHYRFSDDGAMLKSTLVMRGLHTVGVVLLDGRRQIALTAHYISTFFDVYLKGQRYRSAGANRSIRRLNTSTSGEFNKD
jgi:hypothetical protein